MLPGDVMYPSSTLLPPGVKLPMVVEVADMQLGLEDI